MVAQRRGDLDVGSLDDVGVPEIDLVQCELDGRLDTEKVFRDSLDGGRDRPEVGGRRPASLRERPEARDQLWLRFSQVRLVKAAQACKVEPGCRRRVELAVLRIEQLRT